MKEELMQDVRALAKTSEKLGVTKAALALMAAIKDKTANPDNGYAELSYIEIEAVIQVVLTSIDNA